MIYEKIRPDIFIILLVHVFQPLHDLRQAYRNIRSVSEKAILSHEAGKHFILNFTIK